MKARILISSTLFLLVLLQALPAEARGCRVGRLRARLFGRNCCPPAPVVCAPAPFRDVCACPQFEYAIDDSEGNMNDWIRYWYCSECSDPFNDLSRSFPWLPEPMGIPCDSPDCGQIGSWCEFVQENDLTARRHPKGKLQKPKKRDDSGNPKLKDPANTAIVKTEFGVFKSSTEGDVHVKIIKIHFVREKMDLFHGFEVEAHDADPPLNLAEAEADGHTYYVMVDVGGGKMKKVQVITDSK
jgi:hypothetical protein